LEKSWRGLSHSGTVMMGLAFSSSADFSRALADTEALRAIARAEMVFVHRKRVRLGRLRLRGPGIAQDEFTLGDIAENLPIL
jgi:hypothetical protein